MTAGAAQPLTIRTTGTTGLPKAARHDWRVLSQTVAGIHPAPRQRWLLAYGLHQFAGVQVLLHVVASQATLVAPFPRQPRDGLDALLRDGVTCVSATPTYWRFLLTEARSRRVDPPPLEQVTLGGEASPADLLEELRRTFPAARISQVYASTELGSVTSVRDGLPGIGVHDLFSDTNPRANVRVTDGELWVRPAAGMLGYAGHDAAAAVPGEWRPTGDLVEIADGRVLFRGRTSEVINVGGVKVHPLPVEERIAALDSVAAAPGLWAIEQADRLHRGGGDRAGAGCRGRPRTDPSRSQGGAQRPAARLAAPAPLLRRGDRDQGWQDRARDHAVSPSEADRVALVTGGSKGLGAGLVQGFLDAGYCVETCARTATDAVQAWEDDVQCKERFHFSTADVSDPEQAARLVRDSAQRWGRLDVLVNNAGVAREGVIGLFGDDALDQVVDLNLKGTVYVTRAASRIMLARRAGQS